MKKFVKIIAIVVSLLLVFSFSACSKDEKAKRDETSQSRTTKKPQKDDKDSESKRKKPKQEKKNQSDDDDVLTMVTNAEFPPFEFYENDKIVGADIEMAYAIAKKLGMKLKISDVDFDSVIASVDSGKYDIGVSAITLTDDRREIVNFSIPYYVASQAIIVMEGSDIERAADLKDKTISCQEGTTGEMYVLDSGYDVRSFKTGADAFDALTQGKVDAVVIDIEVARALCAQSEGTKILDEALAKEEYAIAIKLGNDELTKKINKAIRELQKEGKLQKIFEKYGLPIDMQAYLDI